jgi:hypothetical protein
MRLWMACIAVGILCGGCRREQARPDSSSTTTITAVEVPAGAPPQDPAVGTRTEYVQMAMADMDNIDERIDKLAQRADTVLEPGARAQSDEEIRNLRSRARALRMRVVSVQQMSDDTWKIERPHLQADWELLSARIDRLGEQMSERP